MNSKPFPMKHFLSVCKRLVSLTSTLWITFFVVLVFGWVVASTGYSSVVAQELLQWAPVQRIPDYDQAVWTPYLVVDQNRTVHAFVSDFVGDEFAEKAVLYRQWTVDGGWTKPIDVLLSPINEARVNDVFLDQQGTFHLVFFGGDGNGADIYYSSAPAALADGAPAWSTPEMVGSRAIDPDDAIIAGDAQGNLAIVYSGDIEGHGLYALHSSDAGATWSKPVPIFLTYDQTKYPFYLHSYVDEDSNIHLVWTLANNTGNFEVAYYVKYEASEGTWGTPFELAKASLDGKLWTISITGYQGELFVIYHDWAESITRYMKRSSDGGQTWTNGVRLFPHVGSNGPASLVVDSNDVLHMFFGNRVDVNGETTNGMWHSLWRHGQWTPPRAIVSGEKSEEFDPSFARAIVVQGNVLLLTWMTDPGAIAYGTGGTWYTYAKLNTPEFPVAALPVPSPTATATEVNTVATVVHTAVPTPHPVARDVDIRDVSVNEENPALPLVFGIIPCIILISIVLGRNFLSSNK